MRYVKCVFVFACLAVLVVSGMAGGDLYRPYRGDTNGDRSVNILDVQKVVSQVLHGSDRKVSADVNGDGAVDIRDFQYVLHYAEKKDRSDDAEPVDDGRSRSTAGSPCRLYVKNRIHTHTVIKADEDVDSPDFRPVKFPFKTSHTRTERYLFRLTPHAPPSCA